MALALAGCGRGEPRPLRERVAEGDVPTLERLRERGQDALAEVETLLQDDDPRVVRNAVTLVELLHADAGPAVPRLVGLLAVPEVERAAANALRALEPDDVPAMLDAFRRGDAATRKRLVRVWSTGLPPEAADAVPGLTALLESDDRETKVWAAMALANVGGASKPALEALRAAAEAVDGADRRTIEGAIRRIGAR